MSRFRKLSHTVWECKYHVVWIPKYRYRVLTDQVRRYTHNAVRELCRRRCVDVLELNVQEDPIHLLASIPPSRAVSDVMGYVKGKSALSILRKFFRLGRKFAGKNFWSRGYAVSTVGMDEETIRKYVRWQQKQDRDAEQQTLELK